MTKLDKKAVSRSGGNELVPIVNGMIKNIHEIKGYVPTFSLSESLHLVPPTSSSEEFSLRKEFNIGISYWLELYEAEEPILVLERIGDSKVSEQVLDSSELWESLKKSRRRALLKRMDFYKKTLKMGENISNEAALTPTPAGTAPIETEKNDTAHFEVRKKKAVARFNWCQRKLANMTPEDQEFNSFDELAVHLETTFGEQGTEIAKTVKQAVMEIQNSLI